MNSTTILPDQRVSDAERSKAEWYIPTCDYIINKALGLNYDSKLEAAENIAAAEGIITDNTYKYVTKAFGINDKDDLNLPNKVRDVSLILPIKRRYIGEYIRQYKNFQVYHKDIDAIKERNKQLSIELEQLIAQDLVNILNEANLPSGGKSKQIPNIEQHIKDFQDNWIDTKVIESQQILNLFEDITNADTEYIKAFYYYWATEEVYSYRRVVGENVVKEIVSPLEYFRIPSGNQFVEDDDMGVRQYMLSFNQINEQLVDKLSNSDLMYLRSMENYNKTSNYKSTILDSRYTEDFRNTFSKRDEYNYISQLPDYSGINFSNYDLARFNWIYHVVYKSECKVGILKYIDPFGVVQEKIVNEKYKITEEAGDIEIEWQWVSRFYQQWRIGDQYTGIYTKPELIEPQRQDVNILSKCKSPYNGITGTFDPNIRNSICRILKQYEALYRIYHYQQERAIAKFRSTLTIIPESLLLDSKELTRLQKMKFAKRDDILYINDSVIDANSFQALKTLNLSGSAEYIKVLSELIQAIKNEAWEVADMNSQRFGDIDTSQGKGTMQMAISKAQAGSILLFTLFNKFVELDKEADIDYCKVAWLGGKKGSYLDKKTNKIVYVEVDGEDFFNRNIGVFCSNSSINDEKIQQFRQLAFAAGQSGDFDIAADSIELENSTEIHKLIKETVEKKKAFEEEMNERNAQATENAAKTKAQSEQAQREFDKYKVDTESSTAIQVAKIRANTDITTSNIKANSDIDKQVKTKQKEEDKLINQK